MRAGFVHQAGLWKISRPISEVHSTEGNFLRGFCRKAKIAHGLVTFGRADVRVVDNRRARQCESYPGG